MNPPPRTAVVVGASISGLASALCLCKERFRVTVLDAGRGSESKRELVLSPPNMTRVLESWGINCASLGPRYKGAAFIDKDDLLGQLQLPPEMIEDLGADYYYFHYSDLVRTLRNEVEKAGGKVCFNSRVDNIDPDSGTVYFQRTSRSTITADLVVIADGRNSIHRSRFIDQVPVGRAQLDTDSDSGSERSKKFHPRYLTLVGHVSKKEVEEMNPYGLDREGRMTLWMASHAVLLGLICANGDLDLSFRYCPDPNADSDEPARHTNGWGHGSIPPQVLDGFSSNAQQLIKSAHWDKARGEPSKVSWALSKSTKVILVGDAAHPWLPTLGGGQRHAMGIEDAATLERLFSLRLSPETLICAYNTIRGERWEIALISDRERFDYMCLPPGIYRDERSLAFRAATCDEAQEDDGMLCAMWGGYVQFFNYDAAEAVDEWWHVARHSSFCSF